MEKKTGKIYPRIEILDPAAQFDPDAEDNSLDQIFGTIRKINKNGIQIATFQKMQSESVKLQFVELENQKTEIEGRVSGCSEQETGTFAIEIQFHGTTDQKIEFVKKISSIMPLIYQSVSITKSASPEDVG